MAVYVDGLRWWGMKMYGREVKTCHMTADSVEELQTFADKIGVHRCWLHNGSRPHYDLTARMRNAALEHGAVVRRRRGKG